MKKKIGIVFGGGGSRCFAHLGVVQELQNRGIPIDYILGCSTGSLMAALVANNVPIDRIKEEFYRPVTQWKWYIPNGFFTFSQRVIRDLLGTLLPVQRIERSLTPVGFVATSIRTGETRVFDRGDIVQAVCASSAHPAVHKPICVRKDLFTDGGLVDNVPADLCRAKMGKSNIVISSSLEGPLDTELNHVNHLNCLFRSIFIPLLQSRSRIMHAYSDVIIEPLKDVRFNFTNWNKIMHFDSVPLMEHFFELGRAAARRALPSIEKRLRSR